MKASGVFPMVNYDDFGFEEDFGRDLLGKYSTIHKQFYEFDFPCLIFLIIYIVKYYLKLN